jgi:hypothetical protein
MGSSMPSSSSAQSCLLVGLTRRTEGGHEGAKPPVVDKLGFVADGSSHDEILVVPVRYERSLMRLSDSRAYAGVNFGNRGVSRRWLNFTFSWCVWIWWG